MSSTHPRTAPPLVFPGGLATALWVMVFSSLGAQPLPSAAPADVAPHQPASTRRMADRLRAIAESDDIYAGPFEFSRRAERLAQQLAQVTEDAQRTELTFAYADALLHAGKPEAAIEQFARHKELVARSGKPMPPAVFARVMRARAIAHLRAGELENCLHNHNAESCLFPIRGGGVHVDKRGSRGAIAELMPLLERYPGDLSARWLLNIAHMTLGEYPDEVPSQYLIDPSHFASDYDIKRFPDVAGALGLDVDDLAGGVVVDDFDRDGWLDVLASASGTASPLRFFRNRGDGTFVEATETAGLAGLLGGLNLVSGDFNNDGLIDVVVLRGGWLGEHGNHPDSLLRNDGGGRFTDVTEESGLFGLHPGQTATWLDYNGDGWLDLYFGYESDGRRAHPNQLFRNNRDGTFTECAEESGVATVGFVKAVVSGDFNNDGRPDLYVSQSNGANQLFRNDGPASSAVHAPWKFTDVAAAAGVSEPFRSFSCWFFDYDNDGWLDLFVAGYLIIDVGDVAADVLGLPHAGERAKLYRNLGDGTFADVTRDVGLHRVLHTMGGNFGDLDNDGWLDFYAGTGDPEFATLIPSRMFRNEAGHRFQDVTTSGGFGQLQKGHGIAFADLDHDGDQDIYSVVGGAISSDNYRNQLFANPGHGNRWLKLELEGARSNRIALGARLKIVLRGPDGERTLHRSVTTGGSFGCSPFRQEIGLGHATEIVRVEIDWPATGAHQVVTGLQPDRAYKIKEDAPAAVPVELAQFALPTAAAAQSHRHHHE